MHIIRISFYTVCGIILASSLVSCNNKKSTLSKAQQTACYYLYNKSLLSDTFARVLFNTPIDFRGINIEENKLYFIFKKELGKTKTALYVNIDTSLVEFAPCESGFCDFGGLQGNIDGYYAFKTSPENLKIDSTINIKCQLATINFDVSFKELSSAMDSTICYNTPKYIYLKTNQYAANIGAYISQKNKDPIIKRLAQFLTKGLSTNEEKAQHLLHFVSTEITYSYEDYWFQSEITKRAHEVLLSGDGDCSSKTIFYASLLEQCDIPYCLLYFNKHINVGVKGNFPNKNKYIFTKENNTYYMAETTTPNYIIGESLLGNPEILSTVLMYQNPRESEKVYNAKTNNEVLIFNERNND
jgi:hypothetical protein